MGCLCDKIGWIPNGKLRYYCFYDDVVLNVVDE